jgi:ABC-type amino acid transport substrate-binding protein
MGYRDANNEPAGMDVDYCKDLAKSLDVEATIIPLTWAERLPLIATGRGDVVFGSTSDTLERAKTVGFSIPYVVFKFQGVVNKEAEIHSLDDIRGKRVAGAIGTLAEQSWLKKAKEWGEEKNYQSFQSENEVFLAVSQGKADIGITTNTAVKAIIEQNENLLVGPVMPFVGDYASAAAKRTDVSWLNYLNLFVHHQVRSGRYAELWSQYVGTETPDLAVPNTYY